MKKRIAYILVVAVITVAAFFVGRFTKPIQEFTETSDFLILDSADITPEILKNRTENKQILVERIKGVCTSNTGDGKIIVSKTGYGDYISYSGINGVKNGDRVTTYLIYNPKNNYSDDVIERIDILE